MSFIGMSLLSSSSSFRSSLPSPNNNWLLQHRISILNYSFSSSSIHLPTSNMVRMGEWSISLSSPLNRKAHDNIQLKTRRIEKYAGIQYIHIIMMISTWMYTSFMLFKYISSRAKRWENRDLLKWLLFFLCSNVS